MIKLLIIQGIDFVRQLFLNRYLIHELTKRDFSNRYIKNYFGLAWSILDPLAFIVILYFVFGMRYGDNNVLGVPFIVYLITGYIAYDFFSNTLTKASNSIVMYSFLLKKMNFRVAILPIIQLLSSLYLHMIILLITFVILIINRILPTIYWLQLIYYIISISCFLIGLSWFTSSVSLFFPDLKNVINIGTRLLFFITPIFWNIKGVSDSSAFILKLNPMFYIVEGYRDSLLYGVPFWQHPLQSIYFWSLTIIISIIGVFVFRRLRPHFADVVY